MTRATDRPAVRHRHPADARDAPGDGRGRGRRRRLRRGPDRQRPRAPDGRAARQGGRAVRAVGDDGQPDRRRRPRRAGRRAALRLDLARLRLGRGRHRPALGRDHADHRRRTAACSRLATCSRQDPARRRPLRPDPAGLPGEHAQPRRRTGPPDRERRRDRGLGAVARPGHAPRRRPADERGRRLGHRRAPSGRRHFDTVSICFSKGLGAPVGSALAGLGRADPQGAPAPQGARRRDAAGGHPRRRRPCTPWTITSSDWPTTTPTPSSWPAPSRRPTGCAWSRVRSRRTSSGSRSIPRSGPPPTSPPGSARPACWSRRRGRRCSAPAPTWTSRRGRRVRGRSDQKS